MDMRRVRVVRFVVALVCAAAAPAQAQVGASHAQDLEFLARMVASCYASGQMAFGQRVIQRRFVESFLESCHADRRLRATIDTAFARDAGLGCNMTRFFEVKDRLQQERDRGRC